MKIVFEQNTLSERDPKSYAVEIVEIEPHLLKSYLNKEYFDELCMHGCPNYDKKWSCPPFAPVYMDFIKKWKKLFVVYMQINLKQFSYIKNDYLKIKAANVILKSRADKFLRKMAKQYGNYISTGSCRLCRPCKCKIGLPCAHPDIMTYSLEALGIDVSQLVDKCFNKSLLWYKPHCLPEYTSVVCGLLTNAKITAEDIQEEYLRYMTN